MKSSLLHRIRTLCILGRGDMDNPEFLVAAYGSKHGSNVYLCPVQVRRPWKISGNYTAFCLVT